MSKPKKPTAKSKKPSKSATSVDTPAHHDGHGPESDSNPDITLDAPYVSLDSALLVLMERLLQTTLDTVEDGDVRDPKVLSAALVMLGLELMSQHTGHAAIACWLEELADTYRKSPGRESPGRKSPDRKT